MLDFKWLLNNGWLIDIDNDRIINNNYLIDNDLYWLIEWLEIFNRYQFINWQ